MHADASSLLVDGLRPAALSAIHRMALTGDTPTGALWRRNGPLSSEIAAWCAPAELGQGTDAHLRGIAATPGGAGVSTPAPFPKRFDQDLRLP